MLILILIATVIVGMVAWLVYQDGPAATWSKLVAFGAAIAAAFAALFASGGTPPGAP